MSGAQKAFVIMGVLVLIPLGGWMYYKSEVSKVEKRVTVAEGHLKAIKVNGQVIYHHQKEQAYRSEEVGPGINEKLAISQVLSQARKYNLGTPPSSSVNRVKHPHTYEDVISLIFKDKELESVVKFLLGVEQISGSIVKKLSFLRDKDDIDKWDASLTISKFSARKKTK